MAKVSKSKNYVLGLAIVAFLVVASVAVTFRANRGIKFTNSSAASYFSNPLLVSVDSTLNVNPAVFAFSYTGPGSKFFVDVSTDPTLSASSSYMNFGTGNKNSNDPIQRNLLYVYDAQKWPSYSCAKLIYWRVRDNVGNVGPIFKGVTGCGAFTDVLSKNNTYYNSIQILYAYGLTGGCSTNPPMFCPDKLLNRGEAAVFMMKAVNGPTFVPPAATHIFKDDWSKMSWAEPWAEAMYKQSYSAGCSTSPLKFCPSTNLNKAEVAVFALKMRFGTSYNPPAAKHIFKDSWSGLSWAEPWAEAAYNYGIIKPCTTSPILTYCPTSTVTRAIASDVIVQAKQLFLFP
jgi:hypothetical protein